MTYASQSRKLFQLFMADDAKKYVTAYEQFVKGGGTLDSLVANHPLADEWREYTLEIVSHHLANSRGYVYVALNAVNEGFLKVGKTRLLPEIRMKKLGSEGVVGEFHCLKAWSVSNRHGAEAACHAALKHYPRHKEFFVAPWQDLIPLVDATLSKYHNVWSEFLPEALPA